jgi:hypothetical protein
MAEPNGDCELSLADVIACLHKLGQHIAMFSEVVKLTGVVPATAGHLSNGGEELQWIKAPQDVYADMHVAGTAQQLGHTPCPQALDMSTGRYQRGQGVYC